MSIKPLIIKFPEGGKDIEGVNINNPNIWNDKTIDANKFSNIKLSDKDDSKVDINVKSIPSPFARMILFKNAFDEKYYYPLEMKKGVFEEILDLMEFLFLIKSSSYFDKLQSITVDLNDIAFADDPKTLSCHKNYLNVLNEFAEIFSVGNENHKYDRITILYFQDGPEDFNGILCGTSPFTVFFTPEKSKLVIPGYFEKKYDDQGNRIYKNIKERNVNFIKFIMQFKNNLPYSSSDFKSYLANKLSEYNDPLLNESPIKESELNYIKFGIEIIPGINFPFYDKTPDVSSYYKLFPTIQPINEGTREYTQLPLVLIKNAQHEYYYDNKRLPNNWDSKLTKALEIDKENKRDVLPESTDKYPWIYPEFDFLEDKLIKLPHLIDSQRMYDGDNQDKSNFQYLIPLKEKYFEYFKPEDTEKYLKYEIINNSSNNTDNDKVIVTLIIPVEGNSHRTQNLIIKKTYNLTSVDYNCFEQDTKTGVTIKQGIYFALWPTLLNPRYEQKIERYYALEYQKSSKLDAKWKETVFYYYKPIEKTENLRKIENNPNDENEKNCISEVERNVQTKLFSMKHAPEIIQLVTSKGSKGILLPKFDSKKIMTGSFTEKRLTVGIDFGTSNTVVAYTQSSDPEIFLLSLNNNYYTKIYEEGFDKNDEFREFDKVINMFFIPLKYGELKNGEFIGKPFSTEVCFLNPVQMDDTILYSNITFKREIPGDSKNEIKTNLKWAKDDPTNKKLIKMFFVELKAFIEKYALENGIDTKNISYKYSYPLAFTEKQIITLKQIFNVFNNGVEHEAFDESQCSQKFFTYFDNEALAMSNQNPAITVDIGGGTSDIVGYMQNSVLFKNSTLFGGQNLLDDLSAGGPKDNPFVKKLEEYLLNLAKKDNKVGFDYSHDIFSKYKDSHSLFSYIVSKDQFRTNIEPDLHDQSFYEYFRLTILYFYSAIIFFIGLNVRKYFETSNKDLKEIKGTKIAFGGNGSKFLNWICVFDSWDKYLKNSTLFNDLFEEVYCSSIGIKSSDIEFKIIQSKSPKEEVVKGLLIQDKQAEYLSKQDADSMFCGEDLVISTERVSMFDDHSKIQKSTYSQLKLWNFKESQISKFNLAFINFLDSRMPEFRAKFDNPTLTNFKQIIQGINETRMSDELNKIIQKYFADRDENVSEYNNSYFMTEVKACIQIIKKELNSIL